MPHPFYGHKTSQSYRPQTAVDSCLLSLTSEEAARALVDQLQQVLAEGGFELRQWSSNQPTVISHLPSEAWSDSAEWWIAQGQHNTKESALGLH